MPLAPPQKHEVLPECKTLIEDSDFATMMGGNGTVVVTEGNVLEVQEEPTPAGDGSWWRVVLMPVINGLDSPDEHLDKVRGYPFRVRCDFNPPDLDKGETYDDIGLDLEAFLEGAHQQVYEALNRKTISLDKAEQLYSVTRRKAPGNMFRDDKKQFRFMTAKYLTVLGPTT